MIVRDCPFLLQIFGGKSAPDTFKQKNRLLESRDVITLIPINGDSDSICQEEKVTRGIVRGNFFTRSKISFFITYLYCEAYATKRRSNFINPPLAEPISPSD